MSGAVICPGCAGPILPEQPSERITDSDHFAWHLHCVAAIRDARPLRHCLEEGPPAAPDCATTCMLEAGHDGAHVWTRADEIHVFYSAC